jgi:hypothetical protein
MLYDIDRVRGAGVSYTLYADDLAMWAEPPFRRLCLNQTKKWRDKFQQSVDKVNEYMTENGFSLSAEKTVLTLFTTGKYNKEDIYVTIDNLHIYTSPFVKYF